MKNSFILIICLFSLGVSAQINLDNPLSANIIGPEEDICLGEEVALTLDFQNPDNWSFQANRAEFGIVPDAPELRFGTGPFSVEAWVRVFDEANTFQAIVSKVVNFNTLNGYQLGYEGNNIILRVGDGTNEIQITGFTNVNDGQWHHIAATFNRPANAQLFVDGNLDGQQDMSAIGPVNPSEPLSFSGVYVGGNALNLFNGAIDEVRIWNSVRTNAEINNRRFTHFDPSFFPNLIGYWDFNEGTGDVVVDCASGLNGVLSTRLAWGNDVPPLNWTFAITWSNGSTGPTQLLNPTDTFEIYATIGYCKYLSIDTIQVNMIDCADGIRDLSTITSIWIPNAFTPNDDTKNDEFRVLGANIFDYHIIIFNRLGNKVYESKNVDRGWNGENPDGRIIEGVYTYVIRFRDIDGERQERYGYITLMR